MFCVETIRDIQGIPVKRGVQFSRTPLGNIMADSVHTGLRHPGQDVLGPR